MDLCIRIWILKTEGTRIGKSWKFERNGADLTITLSWDGSKGHIQSTRKKTFINFFLQKHHKFSNLKDAWAVCFITLIQKLKKKIQLELWIKDAEHGTSFATGTNQKISEMNDTSSEDQNNSICSFVADHYWR